MKSDWLKVHLTIANCSLKFFDSSLTGLIFTLYSDDDPVIENIENLEGLARDLVQDQARPSKEQIKTHREVLTFLVQNSCDLVIQ